MQIRILIGLEAYPKEESFPLPKTELHIVDYPMRQNHEGEDPDHPVAIEIRDDEELEQWANGYYKKWKTVDLNFSSRALTDPTGLGKQAITEIDNSTSDMEVAISLLGVVSDTVTANLTRAEQDFHYHVLDALQAVEND